MVKSWFATLAPRTVGTFGAEAVSSCQCSLVVEALRNENVLSALNFVTKVIRSRMHLYAS